MAPRSNRVIRENRTRRPTPHTVAVHRPTRRKRGCCRKMCECFATCGRLLITVFNLIFSLVGIVLLAVGIIVKVQSPLIDSLLEAAQKQFQSAVSNAGFSSPSTNFNIYDLVGGLAIVFIALGCFFLVIGALGVVGACCKVRILLILYVILMIIILLAQIGVVVCVFAARSVFDSTIKQGLKDVIKNEFTGINGTSAGNLAFNFLMTSQSCCGVDDYNDFSLENAPKWVFRSYNDGTQDRNLTTPMACCKNTTQAPSCAELPDATDGTKNNYNKGCYDALWNVVYSYTAISIGVVSGICALQLLLIIFGISIICQIDKDKVGSF